MITMKARAGLVLRGLSAAGLAFFAIAAASSGGRYALGTPQTKAATTQIRKFVTDQADFVLYMPKTWTCSEKTEEGWLTLTGEDPGGQWVAEMSYGPGGQAAAERAGLVIARLARRDPGLSLSRAMRSNDGTRIVFDGTYRDPGKGVREFRCWVSSQGQHFTASRIEGPQGRLDENREMLLSVLANVRLIKGAFGTGAAAELPLVQRRLRDGSAAFSVPADWNVQDLGKAQFVALDPGGRFSFMVALVEMVTPQLGVNPPGVPVLPYMSPHDALKALCARAGIATNMRFLWTNRHPDMERELAARPPGGGASSIEDFLYTCDGRIGKSKGFTFGIAVYSRLGTNWSLSHFTVAGPEAEFDGFAPNFVNMLQSYRINEAWVGNYIRQGLDNLRRLQRQTSQIVARNAQEIHAMMQAAYEERQTSQDYIDDQRTNYIRGQQDWISSVEGGTIYHSDTWGLTNTATGDFYEGQPFDYVHFKGENPKYRETMTAIDSRELWQQNIRNR